MVVVADVWPACSPAWPSRCLPGQSRESRRRHAAPRASPRLHVLEGPRRLLHTVTALSLPCFGPPNPKTPHLRPDDLSGQEAQLGTVFVEPECTEEKALTLPALCALC